MNFKKIFSYLDQNLLFILTLILIVFIPLYPKWPLFDILPGYNVRVRLDDFFVLFACFIYIAYLIRGKIKLTKIPLAKPILFYLTIGLLSTLSAIFITKTVYWDSYHIAKIFLHFFRRIEYFSLFFISYSSIYNKKQVKIYLATLIFTVLAVSFYGIGQKYWYFPAYSTMNREFAKGLRLYLMEGSRVLSTFAGHYDFAAFLSMTMLITIPLTLFIKKNWLKICLIIVSFIQLWLLNLTVSRTSFISFLFSITIVFIILTLKHSKKWLLSRYLVIFTFSSIFLFSGPLAERFNQVLNLEEIENHIEKVFRPKPPENGIALNDNMTFEEQLDLVASESDKPPVPADVTYAPPLEEIVATISASNEATYTVVTKERTFSDNALKYGLSLGIRLDTLWPMAWQGFKTNPLLGSGYSTLLKTTQGERTTAESTDNDYLRAIGETGLLGFIFFLYILFTAIKILFKKYRETKSPLYYAIFISGLGIISTFLLNALWIDIWESSKVAYTFWSILGIIMATTQFTFDKKEKFSKSTKKQ